jgi:hypothetical protein
MRMPVLILLAAIAVCGCHVKNDLYNPALPRDQRARSVFTVETRPAESAQVDKDCLQGRAACLETAHVDPNCQPNLKACLAFIEFDEMGEMWDPAQLEAASGLIGRTKAATATGPDGPGPSPIVVVFIHGWKNNAKTDSERQVRDQDSNGNVVGFEGVLEYLKGSLYPTHPIVGIYIGWRGDIVSKDWPVSRQLSYFNREATAVRIPGTSMSAALTRVMVDAHRDRADAQVIMVGHSFGGLVLERALSEPMADFVLRSCALQPGSLGTENAFAWANLVVFVNSAAAASEGKQMLDFLKTQPNCTMAQPGSAHEPNSRRPLFLSISSLGDTATRSFVPIGHGPSYLQRQVAGSWRTYESPEPPEIPSQSTYYLNTLAHLGPLQSHVIIDVTKPGTQDCEPNELYARVGPLPNGHTYSVCEKHGRWNDTPYWAMEMPTTIVPDHSGIFNANLVGLLSSFLLTPEEMDRPELRRTMRVIRGAASSQ